MAHTLGILSKKSLQTRDPKGFSSAFSFRSFTDLGFTFRSLIYFEFFVCFLCMVWGMDWGSVVFHRNIRLLQYQFPLKKTILWMVFAPFSKFRCSCVWICLWILCSVSFVYLSINANITHLDYCSFVVSLEIRYSPPPLSFWKTILPSHQETKLEWMWKVLVLLVCLVSAWRESLKAIFLYPQPSLRSSSGCSRDTRNPKFFLYHSPNLSEQSGCLVPHE